MALKPCTKCDGCGKLASHNNKPWTQFAGLPYGSAEMKVVREGTTVPVVCPDCKAAGVIEEKPITSTQ